MCCYVGALDLPPRTHQVARWKEHRVVQDSVAQSLYAAETVYTLIHVIPSRTAPQNRCAVDA